MEQFKPWTVGKIDATDTHELDKRVEYLIQTLDALTGTIQAELDYIYDVVARRDMKGGA